MAGSTGAADKMGEVEQMVAADVETAKRNLQALVAAGIHAQGLLNEGSSDEDDDDDDDDDNEEGDEGIEEPDYEDEEMASGRVGGAVAGGSVFAPGQYYGQGAGDDGQDSQDSQDDNAIDIDNSSDEDGEIHQSRQALDHQTLDHQALDHQALLSRVANNFRALIGHGLATAADSGAGDDEPPLDEAEAYALACATLGSNLRIQRELRAQLAAIDAAQRRNSELQASIGALLSMQARASSRRIGARRAPGGRTGTGGGSDERSAIDPVTGEARIGTSAFFVDSDGARPPDNRDAVRKKKHPPIVYRARRWTDAERDALVRGVRATNRRILAQRLFAQTQDPRSVWEVDRMADSELEMNLAGLDWKHIARQFVPQHRPVECAIQWATQDHPIINRAPWSKREERALAAAVAEHGGRDWVAIAKVLGTQRTAAQCFQVFQRKLNADMSRSKWSPEEDRVLTEAVMAYGEGDWQAVAACLDNRTGQQVLHRWCKSINPAIRSGRWDRDEDVALLAAVRLYGVGQWTKIAKHVPGRTDVKCRERYMNVLTPDVNNAQWSPDEDARLVAIVARVGIGKWSYVADMLGGRTDNQCWRHWRSLHKRGSAPDPPPADDDGAASDAPEEGTVPSFPEWEAERDETHLGYARTQGGGRKRKTTSGIESARKRQWKRATSTNFVPLLATPPPLEESDPEPMPDAPARLSLSLSQSQSPACLSPPAAAAAAAASTPRRARPSLGLGLNRIPSPSAPPEALAEPSRRSSLRRGRVLNWNNVLQMGVERKAVAAASPDAHIRPVLPTVLTAAALQRLAGAVPEVVDAFNAALVGAAVDDDDTHPPSMASVPMSWLRQRIEALFIWPLMLGTLDLEGMRGSKTQDQHEE